MSAITQIEEDITLLQKQRASETDIKKKQQISETIADLQEFKREIQYEHRMR